MDVVDEIPVEAPWSFGPIPPGSLTAPSYQESVQIAVDWAVNWLLADTRPFLLGGYSQGGEAASRIYAETLPGGRLAHRRADFVAGFCFGNPSRRDGHTYYGGPATPFGGIAQYRLPRMGWEWCELVDPADLYGTCARHLTGEIERDVYTLCTEIELHSGLIDFCRTFIANLIAVIGNLDGDAYDDVTRAVTRHGIDLEGAQLLPDAKLQPLSDRLLSVQGIAAAVAAAIDALIFFCAPPFPTAPHCEYHVREVWPGQTYLGLAIQHVHDWVQR
jgi:hypothetical protein